jgi:hypothetical protein
VWTDLKKIILFSLGLKIQPKRNLCFAFFCLPYCFLDTVGSTGGLQLRVPIPSILVVQTCPYQHLEVGSCRAKKRTAWPQLQTDRLCLRVARLLHERIQITELTTKLRLQLSGFTLTGAFAVTRSIIRHLTCGSMDKLKRIWKAMLTLLIAVLEALVCTLSSAPGVWAQIQGLFHFNTYRLWFVCPFRVVCNTPVFQDKNSIFVSIYPCIVSWTWNGKLKLLAT